MDGESRPEDSGFGGTESPTGRPFICWRGWQATGFQACFFLSRNSATTNWNLTIYQANPLLQITNQTSGSTNVLQPGQTGTVIWTYNGSGFGSGIGLYINGVSHGFPGAGGNQLVSTLYSTAGRVMQMFMSAANTNSPDILFEVVMSLGAMNAQQVLLMDGYLNAKWALHSPTTLEEVVLS